MDRTEPRPDTAYEPRDARAGAVLAFGIGLAAVVALVLVVVWAVFWQLGRSEKAAQRPLPPLVAASLERTPPRPRLETQPLGPRRRLRAEEDRVLTNYGWVDRNGGVVRLPIERAMELVAERGVPGGEPMPAAGPTPVSTRGETK